MRERDRVLQVLFDTPPGEGAGSDGHGLENLNSLDTEPPRLWGVPSRHVRRRRVDSLDSIKTGVKSPATTTGAHLNRRRAQEQVSPRLTSISPTLRASDEPTRSVRDGRDPSAGELRRPCGHALNSSAGRRSRSDAVAVATICEVLDREVARTVSIRARPIRGSGERSWLVTKEPHENDAARG
jgi:hypothetical protein